MATIWRTFRRLIRSLSLHLASRILAALKVRLVLITHPERIGHLALEPDCFLKEGLLRRRPSFLALFLIDPAKPVANRHLLGYWRRSLSVVDRPALARLLAPLSAMPRVRYETHPYAVAINETARYSAIQAEWHGRGPLLRLTAQDSERGLASLEAMGMPPNAWFVGVHCREAGYVAGEIHDYRNASIGNYARAMSAIADRGGWCIRLGDATMSPLPPMKNVIDYACGPHRAEWMDVFLCAEARFILGSSSGLYCVGTAFGVPSALANIVPMSMLSYGAEDINIPKLLYSEHKGRHLSFKEIFSSDVANYRFSELYAEAGIRVEENTAEDIQDLALEMLERHGGGLSYTSEDEALQARFKSLFRPGHYSYGAATRVGRQFLKKYVHLLAE
jgi:putative glycosyltransferase (TIGR04372 family)